MVYVMVPHQGNITAPVSVNLVISPSHKGEKKDKFHHFYREFSRAQVQEFLLS